MLRYTQNLITTLKSDFATLKSSEGLAALVDVFTPRRQSFGTCFRSVLCDVPPFACDVQPS